MVMDLNSRIVFLQNQIQDNLSKLKKTKLQLEGKAKALSKMEEQHGRFVRDKIKTEKKQELAEWLMK